MPRAGDDVPHGCAIGEVGGGFAMGRHGWATAASGAGIWRIAKAERAPDTAAAAAGGDLF